jgi:hypothetical protein
VQVQGAPHGALNFQGTREGNSAAALQYLNLLHNVAIFTSLYMLSLSVHRMTCRAGKAIISEACDWVRHLLSHTIRTPPPHDDCAFQRFI